MSCVPQASVLPAACSDASVLSTRSATSTISAYEASSSAGSGPDGVGLASFKCDSSAFWTVRNCMHAALASTLAAMAGEGASPKPPCTAGLATHHVRFTSEAAAARMYRRTAEALAPLDSRQAAPHLLRSLLELRKQHAALLAQRKVRLDAPLVPAHRQALLEANPHARPPTGRL